MTRIRDWSLEQYQDMILSLQPPGEDIEERPVPRRRRHSRKWGESVGGPISLAVYITLCVVGGYTVGLPHLNDPKQRLVLQIILGVSCLLSYVFLCLTHILDPGVVPPRLTKDPAVESAEQRESTTSQRQQEEEKTKKLGDSNGEESREGSQSDIQGHDDAGEDSEKEQKLVDPTRPPSPPPPSGAAPMPPGMTAADVATSETLLTQDSKDRERGVIWKERGAWTRYVADNDGWRQKQRYCSTCHIWRRPDTAHCDICGFCMRRMDHHCPAMGTCVAAFNHRFFVAFLMSSGTGTCVLLASMLIASPPTTHWVKALRIVLLVLYFFNLLFVTFGLTHCYMILAGQTTRGNIKHTNPRSCTTTHFPEVCCGPMTLKWKVSESTKHAGTSIRMLDVVIDEQLDNG